MKTLFRWIAGRSGTAISGQSTEPDDTLVDSTSNLLGHFIGSWQPFATDADDSSSKAEKDGVIKALLFAADKVATDCGHQRFVDVFDCGTTSIESASTTARTHSEFMKSTIDPVMAMYSDAYAAIAVICNNRLGKYAAAPDSAKVARMAADLYAQAYALEAKLKSISRCAAKETAG